MTDYTWPEDLCPHANSFYLQPHVAVTESPFTRQQQVYGLSAPRWVARASFRGMEDGFAARLDAFLAKIKGPLNRVAIWDWRRPIIRGDHTSLDDYYAGKVWAFSLGETFDLGEGFYVDGFGDVENQAATAGATSMVWSNAAPGVTLFKAGDYFGGDGRVHIITDDAITDSAGNATISFEPPLAATIATGAAVIIRPTAWFRVVGDDAGQNPTDVHGLSEYDIMFVEAL